MPNLVPNRGPESVLAARRTGHIDLGVVNHHHLPAPSLVQKPRRAVGEGYRSVVLDRNTSKQIPGHKGRTGKDGNSGGCSIILRLVGISLRLAFPLIVQVEGRRGDQGTSFQERRQKPIQENGNGNLGRGV